MTVLAEKSPQISSKSSPGKISSETQKLTPDKDKDSRAHIEMRTHKRVIDILYPTQKTVDSLMKLELPAGVEIEIKL